MSAGLSESAIRELRSTELFGRLRADLFDRLASGFRERDVQAGECLVNQGDEADRLFVVITGTLEVLLVGPDESPLRSLGPGSVVGEMAVLMGGTRSATVRAVDTTRVLELQRDRFNALAHEHPEIRELFSRTLLSRARLVQIATHLRDLFGQLDAAAISDIERELTWVQLSGGQDLFRQGDRADGAYILAVGRLRIVVSKDGEERTIDEVGPGQWIGEMALLTRKERSATAFATRDAELVWLSQEAFERLMHRYPQAMFETARTLASRLARQILTERRHHTHTGTIAVVPATPQVDVQWFARELAIALAGHGTALHLTAERVDERMGKAGIASAPNDDPAHLRLVPWLIEQENTHDFVVYQADQRWSGWNDRAIRNADRVLVIADAQADPNELDPRVPPLLRLAGPRSPQHTLVLLQPPDRRVFPGTARWLDASHIDSHFHVRRDSGADVARVARVLTGNAVCLVLGGGASRGLAHIGALRAFEELKIPIDAVGGTSIGAAVGAATALGLDASGAMKVCVDISKHALDLTLPMVSLMSGKGKMKGIVGVAGSLSIEDLLTTFFCISTNLTRGTEVVHRRGEIALAVRASMAVPGLFPPVPYHGDLLVDGGLANNVPVDAMVSLLGGVVIAVDVIPEVDLQAHGELPMHLSGWKVARQLLNPLAARIGMPNMASILFRSVSVASHSLRRAEKSAKLSALYMRPTVSQWNLLDFKSAGPIADEGYAGTVRLLREWWERHGDYVMGRPARTDPARERRSPVNSIVPSEIEGTPPSTLW